MDPSLKCIQEATPIYHKLEIVGGNKEHIFNLGLYKSSKIQTIILQH
jgi:hypothetical protein